jgi:hypothetical protein
MEACNGSCTTLMQGITEIGTQHAMKNHRKARHELRTHVPKKSTEGDRCMPPLKLLSHHYSFSSSLGGFHFFSL